jgi:hypothetical protein
MHEIYLTVGKSIPIGLAFPIFLSYLGWALGQALPGTFGSAFLGTDERAYRKLALIVRLRDYSGTTLKS